EGDGLRRGEDGGVEGDRAGRHGRIRKRDRLAQVGLTHNGRVGGIVDGERVLAGDQAEVVRVRAVVELGNEAGRQARRAAEHGAIASAERHDLVVRRDTRLEAIEQADVQGAAERGRTADIQLTVACARSRATDRLIEGAAGRLREVAGDREDAGRGGAADLAGVDQVAVDVAGAGQAAAGRDVDRRGG